MTDLALAPLGPSDFAKVAGVTVAPGHEVFAGTVREAFDAAEEGVDFHGIFSGNEAVGFFKIDRGYPARYPFAPQGALGLRAFIIDSGHHGQGIATRAVRALPTYLAQHYPTSKTLYLTVNKINPAAIKAYLNGGFEHTGKEWPHGDAGPQHVMRLRLSGSCGPV